MDLRGTCKALRVTQRNPPANDVGLDKRLSDNRDRYIAQSILTGIVDKPEVPTTEQARDILRWARRGYV